MRGEHRPFFYGRRFLGGTKTHLFHEKSLCCPKKQSLFFGHPNFVSGHVLEFHTDLNQRHGDMLLRNISCVVLGRAPGAESLQEQAEMMMLWVIFF